MNAIHEPVLEMRAVTVPALDAPLEPKLRDVDWRVERGELWVVTGRGGAGKTELLLSAAGLIRPLAGTVRLFGSPLEGAPARADLEDRLRVGLLFEHGSRLFHQMNVAENVTLPLQYHFNLPFATALDHVRPLVDWLGLGEVIHQRPDGLLRGLRSRVGLARALSLRPELLLLDNPLAGLPPYEISAWMEILAELRQGHAYCQGRPMTLVVASDDPLPWRASDARQARVAEGRLEVEASAPGRESQG